ncbi:MAG: DEAD/DEAH box helicase [bacterium]
MINAAEIRLTPSGRLRLEGTEKEPDSPVLWSLRKAFDDDWREGVFKLAAEKIESDGSPTLRFWQEFAGRYLTRLCHIPESTDAFEVEAPSEFELASLAWKAPPMSGGEYLSEDTLAGVWESLDQWVREAVAAEQGLEALLEKRAPKWNQVGRVCFHLAENKNDEQRPFAFMASFTTGFGTQGRLKYLPLSKALDHYAGERNRPALIKLLSPVHKAAENLPWVKELVDTGEIYRPMAWSEDRAYQFLLSVPDLEESGLTVRVPNWWKKRQRPQVSVTIGEEKKERLGADALLDFNVKVALGGEKLSQEELAELLSYDNGLVFFKGQWIEVDRDKLKEAIEHWEALQQKYRQGEISFIEGMRLLAGASSDLKHEEEAEEERSWVNVTAGDAMREILAGLREPGRLSAVEPGDDLKTELRPYQREGLSWLKLLSELGLGACLADDMGLGKTIQVLCLLLCRRREKDREHGPSLLVVPASLLGNWKREVERFTPSLKLVFVHPAETERARLEKIAESPSEHLQDADLVVTTYAMLTRQDWLAQQDWQLVILDEAQAIKNPATRQTKAVKKLRTHARIVLTGTPVENRLGDLWSIFDFLNPGLLGSAKVFKSFVARLQKREQDQFAPLRQLVGPYILRRLKTDRKIIADLPEKTEAPRYCTLTRQQIKLYEKTVQGMKESLEKAEGMERRGLVLQTLLRLKQICNHPSQLSGNVEYKPDHSGKFLRLAEICAELAERQDKVLVFTQFREIIAPLAEHLAGVFGRGGLVLHGGTSVKKRRSIVEQFQRDDGPPFFILSLKAGGTGLNLTSASHVIHFDRWWNPAVENQATDRTFRIGQKRNVLVHKFITTGTVEEKIDALIREKRQLAEEVLSGEGEVNLTELPDDELIELVSLDVTRAEM